MSPEVIRCSPLSPRQQLLTCRLIGAVSFISWLQGESSFWDAAELSALFSFPPGKTLQMLIPLIQPENRLLP